MVKLYLHASKNLECINSFKIEQSLTGKNTSSAISNIIAGTVLTYTRAFRLADVVKIGGTAGQVVGNALESQPVPVITRLQVAGCRAHAVEAKLGADLVPRERGGEAATATPL